MVEDVDDALWPYFAPLWREAKLTQPHLLLTGGYALFLKHRWVRHASIKTLIYWQDWLDQTPRVTQDLDLIASLELIGSEQQQKKITALLEKNRFSVVPDNRRWQFQRTVAEGRHIVLDFHTAPPNSDFPNVKVEQRRVKHVPSLKQSGIHGRENPEAHGAFTRPFSFSYRNEAISIPNAAIQVVMKLAAAHDRWVKAEHEPDPTGYERAQAHKHANDIFRAVALATRIEVEDANFVIAELQSAPHWQRARATAESLFLSNRHPLGLGAQRNWRESDSMQICQLLQLWFRDSE